MIAVGTAFSGRLGTGLCMFYKRLDQGAFRLPLAPEGTTSLIIQERVVMRHGRGQPAARAKAGGDRGAACDQLPAGRSARSGNCTAERLARMRPRIETSFLSSGENRMGDQARHARAWAALPPERRPAETAGAACYQLPAARSRLLGADSWAPIPWHRRLGADSLVPTPWCRRLGADSLVPPRRRGVGVDSLVPPPRCQFLGAASLVPIPSVPIPSVPISWCQFRGGASSVPPPRRRLYATLTATPT